MHVNIINKQILANAMHLETSILLFSFCTCRAVLLYYVWAMPKYIEFALLLSHFSMLDCYFSPGFDTINLQF